MFYSIVIKLGRFLVNSDLESFSNEFGTSLNYISWILLKKMFNSNVTSSISTIFVIDSIWNGIEIEFTALGLIQNQFYEFPIRIFNESYQSVDFNGFILRLIGAHDVDESSASSERIGRRSRSCVQSSFTTGRSFAWLQSNQHHVPGHSTFQRWSN